MDIEHPASQHSPVFRWVFSHVVLICILLICIVIEMVLQGADYGFWGSPRWRGLAYQYGGFWRGLLGNWQPNYTSQPVMMFASYGFLHGGCRICAPVICGAANGRSFGGALRLGRSIHRLGIYRSASSAGRNSSSDAGRPAAYSTQCHHVLGDEWRISLGDPSRWLSHRLGRRLAGARTQPLTVNRQAFVTLSINRPRFCIAFRVSMIGKFIATRAA